MPHKPSNFFACLRGSRSVQRRELRLLLALERAPIRSERSAGDGAVVEQLRRSQTAAPDGKLS